MSNVIKLKSRNNSSGVKVASVGTSNNTVDDSDYLKNQLDNAYKQGYKEGQEKARRDLEQDYTNKLFRKYEEVYNILQQYDENLLEYERFFEKLVIGAAYEMSKKIVQREIEQNSVIAENVKASLSKIVGASEVKLKLNPIDQKELVENSRELFNTSAFTKIKIEGDERIERGGCLIETEIGNVDARISTQLLELKKQLEDNI